MQACVLTAECTARVNVSIRDDDIARARAGELNVSDMPTSALEEARERRRQISAVDALVVAIAERHEQALVISSSVADVVAL